MQRALYKANVPIWKFLVLFCLRLSYPVDTAFMSMHFTQPLHIVKYNGSGDDLQHYLTTEVKKKKRHDGNAISLIFQNAKVVSGFIYLSDSSQSISCGMSSEGNLKFSSYFIFSFSDCASPLCGALSTPDRCWEHSFHIDLEIWTFGSVSEFICHISLAAGPYPKSDSLYHLFNTNGYASFQV